MCYTGIGKEQQGFQPSAFWLKLFCSLLYVSWPCLCHR